MSRIPAVLTATFYRYRQHFMITFRSFCSPDKLLGLLIKRYCVPPFKHPESSKVRLYNNKVALPIKAKVVSVIKHWIDHHYEDFRSSVELLRALLQFVKSHISTDASMQGAAGKLTTSIRVQRARVDAPDAPVSATPRSKPPPVMCLEYTEESVHVMNLHPVEIARQLTLIESDLYRAIRAAELSGLAWTKVHKAEAAPNVLRLIHRSNLVTNWVIRSVLEVILLAANGVAGSVCLIFFRLQVSNVTERSEVLSLFLEVLRELRALQNLNGVMEVLSGLQHTSVSRLKLSWADIPAKRRKVLDECEELMDSSQSFLNLRRCLRLLDGPCIPFVGMYDFTSSHC